jgi:hypothetical protein
MHLNDIKQIELRSFNDLKSFKHLNLDSNQISTLKNLQLNNNLETLSPRFNLLTNLIEIDSLVNYDLLIKKIFNQIFTIRGTLTKKNLSFFSLEIPKFTHISKALIEF